jgi:uncharacterized membrane protein
MVRMQVKLLTKFRMYGGIGRLIEMSEQANVWWMRMSKNFYYENPYDVLGIIKSTNL